ncbi:hypothetical protein ANSO36C_15690 [Nostoc cf. commune SO-36]|uniref:Uncharacterized protein n=1 Tax=Nostoc cf. commune SO-36 TaxID=449208 RepID=A0ABN6Q1B3_NOSCO|nr:hypothetical protein [Nostoc commune]BDI15767.1 hypothetical protein ANSO36C_15690 [Nostoc cf. commune SO-36]
MGDDKSYRSYELVVSLCSDFSLPSRLSLLQLCYVGEENPVHQPEGLAAPLGVENHPYAMEVDLNWYTA